MYIILSSLSLIIIIIVISKSISIIDLSVCWTGVLESNILKDFIVQLWFTPLVFFYNLLETTNSLFTKYFIEFDTIAL